MLQQFHPIHPASITDAGVNLHGHGLDKACCSCSCQAVASVDNHDEKHCIPAIAAVNITHEKLQFYLVVLAA